MSVKQPWDSSWKTNCRIKIKGCDGVIVLISKNLKKADEAIWEINCAKEENVPIWGVYMKECGILDIPVALYGIKKITWTGMVLQNSLIIFRILYLLHID